MNRLIFLPFALTIPSIASAQNDKVRENILSPRYRSRYRHL